MQVINMQLKNGVTGVRTDTMYLCGKKTPCMVWDYIDGIDFYPCTDSPDNVYSLLCFKTEYGAYVRIKNITT